MRINSQTYAETRQLVSSGQWRVDVDKGLVYGKRGKPFLRTNRDGYVITAFGPPGAVRYVMVHRVIWEAVHGAIPGELQINHLNGVKHDNRIVNLEVVTGAENVRHAHATGLRDGFRNGIGGRLPTTAILDIYRRSWAGERGAVLATEYGVTSQYIYNVRHGLAWRWLTGHAAPSRPSSASAGRVSKPITYNETAEPEEAP